MVLISPFSLFGRGISLDDSWPSRDFDPEMFRLKKRAVRWSGILLNHLLMARFLLEKTLNLFGDLHLEIERLHAPFPSWND
jgi:hypothetical protein